MTDNFQASSSGSNQQPQYSYDPRFLLDANRQSTTVIALNNANAVFDISAPTPAQKPMTGVLRQPSRIHRGPTPLNCSVTQLAVGSNRMMSPRRNPKSSVILSPLEINNLNDLIFSTSTPVQPPPQLQQQQQQAEPENNGGAVDDTEAILLPELSSPRPISGSTFCSESSNETLLSPLRSLITVSDPPARSRHETQIKLDVRVANFQLSPWQWLKVPETPSLKTQRFLDPDTLTPESVLTLEAYLTCSGDPEVPVWCCKVCYEREAVKKAAYYPLPCPSDHMTNPIDFACEPIVDLRTGVATINFRILCYSRHHNEREGFHINFIMRDWRDVVVANIRTNPVMITDDRKRVSRVSNGPRPPKRRPIPSMPNPITDFSTLHHQTPAQVSRVSCPVLPSQIPTATQFSVHPSAAHPSIPTYVPPLQTSMLPTPMTQEPSPIEGSVSANGLMTPFSPTPHHIQPSISFPFHLDTPFNHSLNPINEMFPLFNATSLQPPLPTATNTASWQYPSISKLLPSIGPMTGGIEIAVVGTNFSLELGMNVFFGLQFASFVEWKSRELLICTLPPSPVPGAVGVQVKTSAPIPIFDPHQQEQGMAQSSSPPLFTYTDNREQDIMSMALQVLGMQRSGRKLDATEVARDILSMTQTPTATGVSTTTSVDSNSSHNTTTTTTTTTGSAYNELFFGYMPLHVEDWPSKPSLEDNICNLLDDSRRTQEVDVFTWSRWLTETTIRTTNQSLLHLSASLGWKRLTGLLMEWNVDSDIQDNNGSTALHLACVFEQGECAKMLVARSADVGIKDRWGRTPMDLGLCRFVTGLGDANCAAGGIGGSGVGGFGGISSDEECWSEDEQSLLWNRSSRTSGTSAYDDGEEDGCSTPPLSRSETPIEVSSAENCSPKSLAPSLPDTSPVLKATGYLPTIGSTFSTPRSSTYQLSYNGDVDEVVDSKPAFILPTPSFKVPLATVPNPRRLSKPQVPPLIVYPELWEVFSMVNERVEEDSWADDCETMYDSPLLGDAWDCPPIWHAPGEKIDLAIEWTERKRQEEEKAKRASTTTMSSVATITKANSITSAAFALAERLAMLIIPSEYDDDHTRSFLPQLHTIEC